jgi:hypothetical protein
MKHVFVLDENIPILAVEGKDDQGNPDLTADDTIKEIGRNCHRIAVSRELADRYWHRLKGLERRGYYGHEPLSYFAQLVKNSDKVVSPLGPAPDLPAALRIKPDDVIIVQCALAAGAALVTTDRPLRDAITACPALGLRVLSPAEALALATSA